MEAKTIYKMETQGNAKLPMHKKSHGLFVSNMDKLEQGTTQSQYQKVQQHTKYHSYKSNHELMDLLTLLPVVIALQIWKHGCEL